MNDRTTNATFYSADLDDEVPASELHPDTFAEFLGGEEKFMCRRDDDGLYVRERIAWPTIPPYDVINIQIRYPEET